MMVSTHNLCFNGERGNLFVDNHKMLTFIYSTACFVFRDDSLGAGESALVFKHGPDTGEHYVITRDLDVGPMSVLQFDVIAKILHVFTTR